MHALRENEENDDLLTFSCMFSPVSLRVRVAALASIQMQFRKSPELAIFRTSSRIFGVSQHRKEIF